MRLHHLLQRHHRRRAVARALEAHVEDVGHCQLRAPEARVRRLFVVIVFVVGIGIGIGMRMRIRMILVIRLSLSLALALALALIWHALHHLSSLSLSTPTRFYLARYPHALQYMR